jgi:hypothetical protein
LDSTPACDEVTQGICKDGLGGNREVQQRPVLVHSGTVTRIYEGRLPKEDAPADHVPTLAPENGASNIGNRQAHSDFLKQRLEVNQE